MDTFPTVDRCLIRRVISDQPPLAPATLRLPSGFMCGGMEEKGDWVATSHFRLPPLGVDATRFCLDPLPLPGDCGAGQQVEVQLPFVAVTGGKVPNGVGDSASALVCGIILGFDCGEGILERRAGILGCRLG